MKPLSLPIHERFLTFQGEGVHAGRKAFFIRTMGCPVKCEWCDSAGTWHPDWMPPAINRIPLDDLLQEVITANPEFVVLTGGEPMIQRNLVDFARMCKKVGYPVHVETCGGFYQDPTAFDWITISPKRAHLPIKEVLDHCSELKLIIDSSDAVDYWLTTLTEIAGSEVIQKARPVWLHPEWSKRDDSETLNQITSTIVKRGDPFRAGWQMHKLYRADALDPRASALAPLGGDPSRGY